jgi:hypothetical protein
VTIVRSEGKGWGGNMAIQLGRCSVRQRSYATFLRTISICDVGIGG